METDPTLLQDPVFSQRRDMGLNPEGAFARGQNDPETRKAVGAGLESGWLGDHVSTVRA